MVVSLPLKDDFPLIHIDLAILAHNEEKSIPLLIEDLGKQSILALPDIDLRVEILANGCSDATVEAAEKARLHLPPSIADRITVRDLEAPGKSRTMNWFLRNGLRPEAEFLFFMDGDIRLPSHGSMAAMVEQMRARPELQVFTSRPVKDIVYYDISAGFVTHAIAAGREGLTDFRRSIAGSLFLIRAPMARRLSLPVGLPVEDGFIRAMVLTEFLSQPEDLTRIDGDPKVFHLYESVRTAKELIRHQTRLVIGSSVNAALFRWLRRKVSTHTEAERLLAEAARDDNWLQNVLAEELPCWPYGYVPFSYITGRVARLFGRRPVSIRPLIMVFPGFALDLVVYVRASMHMMFRPSANHW